MLDRKVKDWASEAHGEPVERTYRSFWISFGIFGLSISAIWLLLFGLSKTFPFVQNGAVVVGQDKWSIARTSDLFKTGYETRVTAFGNSKVLAGFRPSVFDPAAGPKVDAYNLSIPGTSQYLDLLETALAHGNRPTHVLLPDLPNSPIEDHSLWKLLLDNKMMVNILFPFRSFVRDSLIFLYDARHAGGIKAQYRSNAAQVQMIRQDRGYYFIKSQSRFPGDRLPDGFALPTDRPDFVHPRDTDPARPDFKRLMDLADKYNFQVLFVPVTFRRGEFAEAPAIDQEGIDEMKPYPRAHVLGPTYWLYDVSDFSDPIHMNATGAERYSKHLALLFSQWLESEH